MKKWRHLSKNKMELYWQDEFLQWQPDSYQGATEIFLASTDIWIPEFSLYYSLNFNDAVKLLSNNDVRVNYTGHVRYYLPFSTESLCKLDVKFFPFDIQQCTLLFGSWAHSNDSIKYSLYSKNLSLIDFYDNQEWQLDLQHSHIMSDGFLYDYLDPPLFWEMIILDLVVIRQSFYYVFNLVIPSTIITLVAVIGFHTPSTSGRMRDAKFRLGIMSLMSTSVILLAIVEVMPKFSMSSSRKGRGSFSGIPLIGLYYFILLAIIGLSTVTTSMFVFLERDLREKHKIPWFLRWLSFDVQPKQLRRENYRRGRGESTSDALLSGHRHLNGFVGDGSGAESVGARKVKSYAQSMAMSLMKLVPNNENGHDLEENGNQRAAIPHDNPAFDNQSPRHALRRRLSLSHYDNMIVYQYFNQILEDALGSMQKIEGHIQGMRQQMAEMKPSHDQDRKWQDVIRRLEIMSLLFYVTLLFTTMFLFFNHSWYCSVGASVCGQQNLKCPWMPSNPQDPSCQT
uniref:Neurotransmitter-gated ion-channel ligand-binding domain-containing protein n=1 Tax=Panagrolaimus sp. PS1159 TaxID=55785 RepID=A0AC35G6Z8_9BILA